MIYCFRTGVRFSMCVAYLIGALTFSPYAYASGDGGGEVLISKQSCEQLAASLRALEDTLEIVHLKKPDFNNERHQELNLVFNKFAIKENEKQIAEKTKKQAGLKKKLDKTQGSAEKKALRKDIRKVTKEIKGNRRNIAIFTTRMVHIEAIIADTPDRIKRLKAEMKKANCR